MKRHLLCGASLVALLAVAGGAQADGAADGAQAAGLARQLQALIEAAQHEHPFKPGSDKQRIADFYASYMDQQRLEKLGYRPLIGELQRIRILRDRRGLPQVMAHLGQIGVPLPYAIKVAPDSGSGNNAAHLVPGQLGMPDLAAYLPNDGHALQAVRASYLLHIETVLALAGTRDAAAAAQAVLALETRLAALRHEPVQPAGVAIDKLGTIAPGYDWASALGAAGVSTKTDSIVADHPAYLAGFARLAEQAELAGWKAYLEWQLLRSYSPYLSRAFSAAHASFYGMPPVGEPDLRPRWQAGALLVGAMLADLVGKQYAERYFPPYSKARFERIAAGQLAACDARPGGIDGKGGAANQDGAAGKGGALRAKVGYPAKWHSASSLMVSPTELAGNVMRARQLDHARAIARLGNAIDRDEWTSAPHDPRIFYDPVRNEIVLPAAALQPPLVDEQADDAALGAALAARIGQACAAVVH